MLRRFSSSSVPSSSSVGLVGKSDPHNVALSAQPTRTTARPYFVQSPPRIGNVYLEDGFLVDTLRRLVPPTHLGRFEADLVKFGDRVAAHIGPLGHASDRQPATLLQSDGWGVRVDRVVTSAAWDELQKIAVEEGLVAIGYDQRPLLGAFARVYQFAKLYLFAGASAVADCPLAMTNGAAKLVDESADADLRARCLHRLTSRDVAVAVTSGQWMTEAAGGSDVGRTETIALPIADSVDGKDYALHGYKYFTSSINSAVAFVLARTVSAADGSAVGGSRGLSLFQVETRTPDGAPNNIAIHKLKDKLGTKGVPTAELELRGTHARLVGEIGRGVPHIATLFNLTRIHNATAAVANMRRMIAAVRDYTPRRTTLGASLADNALHLQTVAEMEAHCRAALLMVMDSVVLLGKTEVPGADKAGADAAARTLRVATPLLKLFTAKQGLIVQTEGIEALGAHGYMEDSGIPRLLRDSMVLPIWEGTTNVLALDLLRVLAHDPRAVADFMARAEARAAQTSQAALAAARVEIDAALAAIAKSGDKSPASARAVAMALSAHYCTALVSEAAAAPSGSRADAFVAERWTDVLLPAFVREMAFLARKRTDIAVLRSVVFDVADDGTNRSNAGKDVDARGRTRPRL
jgi:putative acyl-CoA dehydrogenase